MNFEDIKAEARRLADDNDSQKYLWSDAEWLAWANEAQDEACRRARLIVDSTTAACCQITLANATATYDIDDRVLFIRRAKLTGRAPVLGRVSYRDLDREIPGWESETGEPRGYIPDMDDRKFRPYPIPNASGTVTLTVIRLPLYCMETIQDEPEIRPHLHRKLIPWMLYRAYSKQDAETRDEKKAAMWLAEFEAEFGKRSTAIDEMWLEREHDFLESEGNF